MQLSKARGRLPREHPGRQPQGGGSWSGCDCPLTNLRMETPGLHEVPFPSQTQLHHHVPWEVGLKAGKQTFPAS